VRPVLGFVGRGLRRLVIDACLAAAGLHLGAWIGGELHRRRHPRNGAIDLLDADLESWPRVVP